jgi:hypothetical protein
MIGEQMIGLSETRFDDGKIYWLESRPPENGRSVIVCRPAAGAAPQDVTAKYEAGCPYYNIRTGAHGYGGGAWIISSGVAYFSNYSDGRLYRQDGIGAKPVPLTPLAVQPGAPGRDFQCKYADGVIDTSRKRWIGIGEDHSNPAKSRLMHCSKQHLYSITSSARVSSDGGTASQIQRLRTAICRLCCSGARDPIWPSSAALPSPALRADARYPKAADSEASRGSSRR